VIVERKDFEFQMISGRTFNPDHLEMRKTLKQVQGDCAKRGAVGIS